jgi:hypothetical protein
VIGNNVDSVAGMSGTDSTITIPSVLIRSSDRNRIVNGLATSAVNVTLRDASGSQKADSHRWLMGEDSTAFGGAIRDMWSPTCLGDPGKVSDAEYVCGTEDSGGVHSNSGVPNHGYALAVDGGTYNGTTVQGIGLTKAAAIYFQAMTAYQTPTSDFTDHADALTSSCNDLVGKPLQKLSTRAEDAGASTEVISTTDCATIGAIIQAVELRTAPTQCNYQPMHNQDRPALCDGKGRGASTIFEEDFEGGIPGDWDADVTSVYGHPGEPWVATDKAPTGNGPAHPGTVAYGPAPDEGTCDSSTAADFSTRDGLITKIIQLPDGTLRAPKLSFDHYVATENGYDGGNVKYRVNGGSFQVIPTAAYLNNGPRQLSTAAQGNTNPMAGEPGFTGTDGGQVDGSWAQSQVDLSMLGVAGGDEIEFRFDIGRDGCGGIDGWYVDDITVTICKIKTKTEAVHEPSPSRKNRESEILVTVVPDGATGTVSGTVVLEDPSGKEVDRAPVTDGRASFTLPRKQPVGSRTFTVDYLESDTYLGSSDGVVVRVVR